MEQLIKQANKQATLKINEFKKGLNELKEVKQIMDLWYYSHLIPKTNKKDLSNIKDLKAYLIARKEKETANELKKQIENIESVFNTGKEIDSICISVEWKKSQMWGNNPTATISINFKDYTRSVYIGKASGCGYDKESASIAQALNQCRELKKLLYTIKNKSKNIKLNNKDIFGYGSGYGDLPYFEGGVGVSCYNSIFEKIGFKFSKTAWGKTFDVYRAERN